MRKWVLFLALAVASSGCSHIVVNTGGAFPGDPVDSGLAVGLGTDDYLDAGVPGFGFEVLFADLEDGGSVTQSRVLSRIGYEAHGSRRHSVAFDAILGVSFNDLDGASGASIDHTTVLVGAAVTFASGLGRGGRWQWFLDLRFIYVPWDLGYGGEEDDYSAIELMIGFGYPMVE